MSVSVTLPTEQRRNLREIRSSPICCREVLRASTEPCTSPFKINRSSVTLPSSILLKRLSKLVFWYSRMVSDRSFSSRSSAICRAIFSSSRTTKFTPTSGTLLKPEISTGIAGPASIIVSPTSLNIARIRP